MYIITFFFISAVIFPRGGGKFARDQRCMGYRNKYREGGDCLDIEDRGWVV